MKNETKKTATKKTATNETKTNKTVDVNALYNDLIVACSTETKVALVNTMNKYGLQCATAPTMTVNKNDLYLQFSANKCGDVTRMQFKKSKILVWCTEFTKSLFTEMSFDKVDDNARKSRFEVLNTDVNFKMVFDKLFANGVIKFLPTT